MNNLNRGQLVGVVARIVLALFLSLIVIGALGYFVVIPREEAYDSLDKKEAAQRKKVDPKKGWVYVWPDNNVVYKKRCDGTTLVYAKPGSIAVIANSPECT